MMSVLVSAVVIAYVAILLLGLAVGGLLAQVRALEARLGRRAVQQPDVVVRLENEDDLPSAGFGVVFVADSCQTCLETLPELLDQIDGGALVIVSDRWQDGSMPLPAGVRVVSDPGAVARSGVPAVPWFVTVDGTGRTDVSFALANADAVGRAAEAVRDVHVRQAVT